MNVTLLLYLRRKREGGGKRSREKNELRARKFQLGDKKNMALMSSGFQC
jgi:hypothetical protein